jgi:hypothetical protein
MVLRKILSAIVFIFLFQLGFAQSFDKIKLDPYLNELAGNNKFMGSVAILDNDNVIYTNSTGFTNLETQQLPNNKTTYGIGSISKVFTSTLIFKAIEEKKLTLSTKLNEYFPSIKNSDKITIGNLLNHRSGIHNFTNDKDFLDWNTQKKSEAEMLQIITNGGSDFEPDSKTDYSNSNYILLSYILEKIYNQFYSNILSEKIIKKLGLRNTYFGNNINETNESYSYKFDKSWVKQTQTDSSIPLGVGAIFSTPTDLTKFASALFNGKIISKQSLKSMIMMKDNFGYGIFEMPFKEKIGYGHRGGIDGFNSVLTYFPKEKISIAIISNGNNYDINSVLSVIENDVFE